jgi:hypothetical protein
VCERERERERGQAPLLMPWTELLKMRTQTERFGYYFGLYDIKIKIIVVKFVKRGQSYQFTPLTAGCIKYLSKCVWVEGG